MLEVTVQMEIFDEDKGKFFTHVLGVLKLEHSLAAVSKWESKWKKPFLSRKTDFSTEEVLDYVRCMSLDPDTPPEAFLHLSEENQITIRDYMDDATSATFFSQKTRTPTSNEPTTSELVYYWMDVANINWEAQYWHINRLFTLIRVHDLKNQDTKPKKLTTEELSARQRENERRRAEAEKEGR